MATITLTLSARRSKDTGKAEILLRYRNTREVALRAHTRVFILPKYFVDGQIIIKNRLITPEVKEAQEAKALINEGHVRMLYPDSPRHPRQKYLLTVKGLAAYKEIKG